MWQSAFSIEGLKYDRTHLIQIRRLPSTES